MCAAFLCKNCDLPVQAVLSANEGVMIRTKTVRACIGECQIANPLNENPIENEESASVRRPVCA